jgi:hypothetical protein
MIALQEQLAAMKKQQSADRLKKDLEEREKKIKVWHTPDAHRLSQCA